MHKPFICLTFASLLLFSGAGLKASEPNLPVHESFLFGGEFPDPSAGEYKSRPIGDNTNGDGLSNQGPTVGDFMGNWSTNHASSNNVYPRIIESSLSHPNHLPSSGGAVQLGRYGGSGSFNVSATRSHDAGPESFREWDPTPETWGSFLFDLDSAWIDSTSSMNVRISFARDNNASNREINFGVDSTNLFTVNRSGGGGGSDSYLGTDPLTAGTHLLVFQIIDRDELPGSTEEVNFWLNPDMSGGNLGPATGTITGWDFLRTAGDVNVFSQLNVSTSVANTNQFMTFDEFRLGTSLESVAIPEPGTLVLVGIALGGLLFFRRRR